MCNREVFKARDRETKDLVALKKVLMENEKEGVGTIMYYNIFNIILTHSLI